MSDEIYHKLAGVLDTLPNGFPATESGVEIKLLQKVFNPQEADLFCDLRLTFETPAEIARRTGRPLEGLLEQLLQMDDHGQLFSLHFGEDHFFRMMPWVFGIYEFQLKRLDREFAELNEAFSPFYNQQFIEHSPQLMQTLPIETEIEVGQEALPFEQVSNILENSQSIKVMDCICKKEQGLLDNPCDRPVSVCMAFAPIPGVFDDNENGRSISKEEARAIIKQAEADGLVHLTSNVQFGHIYICNCCGCCCGVLRSITRLGMPAWQVVNSFYYAEITPDKCSLCGICADERCQVDAITLGAESYEIVPERCIGCGLCITTCEEQAIQLVRKRPEQITLPPPDEATWFKERGKNRGVDFSQFE
ncbi:MAG: 4Fe-4S binding protein [bacterium]